MCKSSIQITFVVKSCPKIHVIVMLGWEYHNEQTRYLSSNWAHGHLNLESQKVVGDLSGNGLWSEDKCVWLLAYLWLWRRRWQSCFPFLTNWQTNLNPMSPSPVSTTLEEKTGIEWERDASLWIWRGLAIVSQVIFVLLCTFVKSIFSVTLSSFVMLLLSHREKYVISKTKSFVWRKRLSIVLQ